MQSSLKPSTTPSIVHEVLNSSGQPLDTGIREFLEVAIGQHFSSVKKTPAETPFARQTLVINQTGDIFEQEADRLADQVICAANSHFCLTSGTKRHDFSMVRIHTDARAAESARALNAKAYTIGEHIVFGAGQYSPNTTAGLRLLAHELTHVLQQRGQEHWLVQRAEVDSAGGSQSIGKAGR